MRVREEEIMLLPALSRDPGNYETVSTVSCKAKRSNYWRAGFVGKCLTGKYEDLNLNLKIDAGHMACNPLVQSKDAEMGRSLELIR